MKGEITLIKKNIVTLGISDDYKETFETDYPMTTTSHG